MLSRTFKPLARDLRSLPRQVWILSGGVFVNRLGAFVWYFLALFLVERGYGPAEAGIALAAFGAGTIPASLIGGWLADSLGRRETIALSMFSGATTFIVLSQARTLALIVALVGLAGFASELYRPASSALIADLTPVGGRVTAYALYRLAFNAGIAAGGVLAGLAASESLFAVFIVESATCAAFGVIALVALPKPGPVAPPTDGAAAAPKVPRRTNRSFFAFLLASGLLIIVQLQQSSTLPLHIDASGLSPAVLGLLLTVNGALIMIVELPASSITQRLPRGPLMALGALLVGLGMAATGAADTTITLLATVVTWTLGEIIFFPLASAHVADTAPPGMQGRYQGLFGVSWSAGITLAPALGLALYAHNTLLLWFACAGAGITAALLVLREHAPTHPQRAPIRPPAQPCCAPCS